MKPYIGATVLYKDIIGAGDVAFIAAVNGDGTINLVQLSSSGHLSIRPRVAPGPGVGQWLWPVVPVENDATAAKATAAANAALATPAAALDLKFQAVAQAADELSKAAPGSPAQDAAIAKLADAKAQLQATANALPRPAIVPKPSEPAA